MHWNVIKINNQKYRFFVFSFKSWKILLETYSNSCKNFSIIWTKYYFLKQSLIISKKSLRKLLHLLSSYLMDRIHRIKLSNQKDYHLEQTSLSFSYRSFYQSQEKFLINFENVKSCQSIVWRYFRLEVFVLKYTVKLAIS